MDPARERDIELLPPPLRSAIAEIEALEARIRDLTPEENARLLTLCHEFANHLQTESLRSVLRPHYVHRVTDLHDKYSMIVESIRSHQRDR